MFKLPCKWLLSVCNSSLLRVRKGRKSGGHSKEKNPGNLVRDGGFTLFWWQLASPQRKNEQTKVTDWADSERSMWKKTTWLKAERWFPLVYPVLCSLAYVHRLFLNFLNFICSVTEAVSKGKNSKVVSENWCFFTLSWDLCEELQLNLSTEHVSSSREALMWVKGIFPATNWFGKQITNGRHHRIAGVCEQCEIMS